jgi:hypothetical protein
MVFTCAGVAAIQDGPVMQQMFAKELTNAGHIRRFTIRDEGPEGWEVRVEQDSTILRRICYNDWHRVERALITLALEVSDLEHGGWTVRTPA